MRRSITLPIRLGFLLLACSTLLECKWGEVAIHPTSKASLTLSFDQIHTDIRTVQPLSSDLECSEYSISGVSDSGDTTSVATTENSVTIEGLSWERWTFQVMAKNSSALVIAQASGSIQLVAGASNMLSLNLTAPPNEGTLNVHLTFPSSADVTEVQALLQDTNGSIVDTKTLTTLSQSCDYSVSVASGSYYIWFKGINVQGKVVCNLFEGVNIVGNLTSTWDYVVPADAVNIPPDAPFLESLYLLSPGSVQLSWNPAINAGDGFRIYRASDGGASSILASVDYGITTFIDSTIVEGSTYDYFVRAFNDYGDSFVSNESTLVNIYAEKPVISPAGGTFINSVSISLGTPPSGTIFRYTVDGIEPSVSSMEYSNPFILTNSATVKAKGFKSGVQPSATESWSFTIVKPALDVSVVATGTEVASGDTLGFGESAVNCEQSLAIRLENTGDGTLTLSSAIFQGPDAGNFSLDSNLPTTIAAGSQADINVKFKPTGYGSRQCILVIQSDDPLNPDFSINLTGFGYRSNWVSLRDLPGATDSYGTAAAISGENYYVAGFGSNTSGVVLKANTNGDWYTPELISWGVAITSLVVEADGSLVVAGRLNTSDSLGIAKFDSNGQKLWELTWGTTSNDRVVKMIRLASGDYFIAGQTVGSSYTVLPVALKVRADGTLAWAAKWNDPVYLAYQTQDVVQAAGGKIYMLATGPSNSTILEINETTGSFGTATSPAPGLTGMAAMSDGTVWSVGSYGTTVAISRFNGSTGAMLAGYTFASAVNVYAYNISADPTGGAVISGSIYESGMSRYIPWLVKVSTSGSKVWEKMYWYSQTGSLGPAHVRADGSLLVPGKVTKTANSSLLLLRIDTDSFNGNPFGAP